MLNVENGGLAEKLNVILAQCDYIMSNVMLELCKGVHCVNLGENFQTHINLQNLASIQPRRSPLKFARSSGA